jgi:hypothetical protein
MDFAALRAEGNGALSHPCGGIFPHRVNPFFSLKAGMVRRLNILRE